MAKKVSNQDLFDANLFQKTTEEVQGLITQLDLLEKKIVEVAKSQKTILNTEKGNNVESIKKQNDAIKTLNESEVIAQNLTKEKIKLEQKLKSLGTNKADEIAQLKILASQQTKINNERAKDALNLTNAYTKLTASVNKSQAEFKKLAAEFGVNSKQANAARLNFEKLDNELRQINNTARDGRRDVGRYGLAIEKLKGGFGSILGALGITTGIYAIGAAFKSAFKTISDYDEGLANIQKVTGLTRKEVIELNKELMKIDTRTSVSNIQELAVAGGKLGLSGKDLVSFTKSADMAFVALNGSIEGSAEDIATTLGKLGNSFGLEQKYGVSKSMDKIGSVLNDLGAKTKAAESPIVDFTSRLAGVASQAGLTLPQVAALGALFDANGQSMEIAATTFQKLLPDMGRDVKRFAKISGVDIKTFSKLLREEPFKALQQVAIGAKSSEKGLIGLSSTLKNYGVDSARAASIVSLLSSKQKELAEYVGYANSAMEAGTSIQKEFEIKNNTLSASVEKLTNNWDKFIISLDGTTSSVGNASKSVIEFFNNAITGLKNWDLYRKTISDGNILGFSESELSRLLDGGWVTEFGLNINEIKTQFDKIPLGMMVKNLDKVKESWIKLLGEDKKEAKKLFIQYLKERTVSVTKLSTETKKLTYTTEELGNEEEKTAKKQRILTGLIEKQQIVVSTLNTAIQQAKTEKDIFNFKLQADTAQVELDRLLRIVNSTYQEIIDIQTSQIKDETDKTIALENQKSEKLIKQIQTNSLATTEVKEQLISAELQRLSDFTQNENIKEVNASFDAHAEALKAEFEQRRTGFKTEKDFEDAKTIFFKDVELGRLESKLSLLKLYNRKEDELLIEQTKAQIEGLRNMGDESKKMAEMLGEALLLVADIVDESFTKKIEAIDKMITKTTERADYLRQKALVGQLASQESLAFEQKKEAELEKNRERERKNQEKAKAFFTVLTTYQSKIDAGEKGGQAITSTIRDISVLKALASGLSGFYEGTDDVGKSMGKPQIKGKDGHIVRVDGSEQIWSKKDRSDVGNRSREEIKDYFNKGLLSDMMKFDKSNDIINTNGLMFNDKRMLGKLNDISNGINSMNIPEGMVHIDEVKQIMTLVSKKGNSVTKTRSKLFN